MKVEYIAQPDTHIGKVLTDLLDKAPARIVFVSAFVSLQTLMRLKQQILELKDVDTVVQFVLGIDLGGTSQEVLAEVLSWGIDCRIVNHRLPGHTFHPKLYLLEWAEQASVIIGSNNFTEGGFFNNYEGAAHITYELPTDAKKFNTACDELRRFLDPDGPVVRPLTDDLLRGLIDRGDVPTEEEARNSRSASRKPKAKAGAKKEPLFGKEDFDPPPPLPAELLERLIKDVRRRRSTAQKAAKEATKKTGKKAAATPIDNTTSEDLQAAAFYMELPRLVGKKKNIPGEGRVPLDAVAIAKEFWGWPDEYTKDEKETRTYWNWKPKWKVVDAGSPGNTVVLKVRMYMYTESSDFRFFASALVRAGADKGDVVRIRRIADGDVEYECTLAKKGTVTYSVWIKNCTQSARGGRKFGYA